MYKSNLSSYELADELVKEQNRFKRHVEVVTSSSVSGCSDDAVVLDHLLAGYDKHKLPGGGHVKVDVEVTYFFLTLKKYFLINFFAIRYITSYNI